MDYDFAARFGELARRAPDRALGARADRRLHGPRRARQEAEHGGRDARPLGRDREGGRRRGRRLPSRASCSVARREEAIDSVCEQLGELRERLEGKDRGVPFGIEVMGRVRELGSADDVVEISRRLGWVRPVLDFAHMHATSDGGVHDARSPSPRRSRRWTRCWRRARRSTSTSRTSSSRTATRRSTSPTAQGTLRAEPLAEALARLRAAGDRDLRVARRGVDAGDPGDPRGVGSADEHAAEAPARRRPASAAAGAREDRSRSSASRST